MYLYRSITPRGWEYEPLDSLGRPCCPQCDSQELFGEMDGSITCQSCGYEFVFLEDVYSRKADGLVHYDQGKAYEEEKNERAAARQYDLALESFKQVLEESEEADLWLLCAHIYAFKSKQFFSFEKANDLEYYLMAMKNFVRLSGENPENLFLLARAWQFYGENQSGSRRLEAYQKAEELFEQAAESDSKEWKEFVEFHLQPLWLDLAIAYEKEEENFQSKEKAGDLYLKLADLIEKSHVYGEAKPDNPDQEYEETTIHPDLISIGEHLELALAKEEREKRMAEIYQRLKQLAVVEFLCEGTGVQAYRAAEFHHRSADYLELNHEEEKALHVMLELEALFNTEAFNKLDFFDSFQILSLRRYMNSRIAGFLAREGDSKTAREYYLKNIEFLKSLQPFYLANDGFHEEEDRAFYQLEAELELAQFYQDQNQIESALEAYHTFLKDFENFAKEYSGSIYLNKKYLSQDENLLDQMIGSLTKLKEQYAYNLDLDALLTKAQDASRKCIK